MSSLRSAFVYRSAVTQETLFLFSCGPGPFRHVDAGDERHAALRRDQEESETLPHPGRRADRRRRNERQFRHVAFRRHHPEAHYQGKTLQHGQTHHRGRRNGQWRRTDQPRMMWMLQSR